MTNYDINNWIFSNKMNLFRKLHDLFSASSQVSEPVVEDFINTIIDHKVTYDPVSIYDLNCWYYKWKRKDGGEISLFEIEGIAARMVVALKAWVCKNYICFNERHLKILSEIGIVFRCADIDGEIVAEEHPHSDNFIYQMIVFVRSFEEEKPQLNPDQSMKLANNLYYALRYGMHIKPKNDEASRYWDQVQEILYEGVNSDG